MLMSWLACDDDDRGRAVLDASSVPLLDAGAVNPEQDATCETSMYSDFDDDGFSRAYGDCNDCDRNTGPAAYDFAGNGLDEDCSGSDATLADFVCDTGLRDDDTDADKAIRAFDVCGTRHSAASGYQGLLGVSFGRLDASMNIAPLQMWLPEHYGVILPRAGARLLAISTGVARDVDERDYTSDCDVFTKEGVAPPKGFPRDAKACGKEPISEHALAFDDVVIELRLRAPFNASAFAFDSLFLSYEYPDYVCSQYNDFFVVLMDPAPKQADADHNILFDVNDDAVGVNTALLSVCRAAEPRRVARPIACTQGSRLLEKTGYDADESSCATTKNGKNVGGASTGWLHTEMPVQPGHDVTLRFILWDSGDPLLDSTVLLDNFRWLSTNPTGNTAPIASN